MKQLEPMVKQPHKAGQGESGLWAGRGGAGGSWEELSAYRDGNDQLESKVKQPRKVEQGAKQSWASLGS